MLGCREEPSPRQSGATRLAYFVKWAERSYSHCCWVSATTALRLAKDKVANFTRTTRGARNVEPEVQAEWSQVRLSLSFRKYQCNFWKFC